MLDIVAAGVGLLAAASFAILLLALALSIPVVVARGIAVIAKRHWVPPVYNLRSLAKRKTMTVTTFLMLALVIFVLTAAAMLARGIRHTLESTGDPRNVKIVGSSAVSEVTSIISEEDLQRLAAAPGIATDSAGQQLISPEMVVLIWAGRAGSSDPDEGANLTVRGVHPVAFDVHWIRQLEGRRFETGRQEVIIGKALVGRFEGAVLGSTMTFAERTWTVVGVADHGGTAHDSEIWGDIEVMKQALKRPIATATVTLRAPSAFDALAATLEQKPQNLLVAWREAAYWRSLSESYAGFVTLMGAIVGLILSFAAVLGSLNTMYAQVAARTRELGTLRAIGFGPQAILTSVLAESVGVSLAAGTVGVLAAALLSESRFTLTTVQTLSEVSYGFRLDAAVVLGSLGFAALMGYAGGLLPALHAARLPIVEAVRVD